ncbi:MAG: sugar transferase [bacterium]|nr:sugar transferase [bacterium]
MYRSRRKESVVLLIGDSAFFALSLPLSLAVRYLEIPTASQIMAHVPAFTIVYVLWLIGLYIFDLYSRQTVAFRRRIISVLVRAQIFNLVIGSILFYVFPYFGIAPKTILILNAIIATALLALWRVVLSSLLYSSRPTRALAIGDGEEFNELIRELTQNPKFNFLIEGSSLEDVSRIEPEVIILDPRDTGVSRQMLVEYVIGGGQVLDARMLYEHIFDRIPLSLVGELWFLANITSRRHRMYSIAKRLMDIVISAVLLVPTLLVLPFVAVAIVIESGRPIYIGQTRVGRFGRPTRIFKFRSMTSDDGGVYTGGKTTLAVTSVGAFMRRTRIDELPQLFNVLRGDISLVGPRLELPALAAVYREKIPYYDLRHVIQPGLSGWAQIYQQNHPHHGEAVEQTRDKLSYDLYYIKNRSFALDVKIALKTIKTIFFLEGV